jgi:hypothetical protein
MHGKTFSVSTSFLAFLTGSLRPGVQQLVLIRTSSDPVCLLSGSSLVMHLLVIISKPHGS